MDVNFIIVYRTTLRIVNKNNSSYFVRDYMYEKQFSCRYLLFVALKLSLY